MSAGLEINGSTLVPIKVAAAGVAYSRDYVARLAREGKIVASQVGRQWYVDPVSLLNFSRTAELHDELRKKELRQERKRERFTKEQLDSLGLVVARKESAQRKDALVVLASALCLSFVVGVSIHLMTQLSHNPVSRLILALSDISSLSRISSAPALVSESLPVVDVAHETLLLTSIVETPVFVPEVETRSLRDMADGIILFARGGTDQDKEKAESLFSDVVEVTYTSDTTGVISYETKNGEILKYQFLDIPTDANKATP